MAPIIGLTPIVDDEKKNALYSTYVDAINDAGGLAIILPYTDNESVLRKYAELCDGFLFTGGVDLSPAIYGEDILPECGEIQKYRDEYELRLLPLVLKEKKPSMFICRGAQVLNVGLGGTLYQDIGAQYKTDIQHSQKEPKSAPSHEVNVISETPLYSLVGKTRMTANSFHHQAVKDVGVGLAVMARADDGIIEALYGTGDTYIRAYQWHPERLARLSRDNDALFVDFIKAAKKN